MGFFYALKGINRLIKMEKEIPFRDCRAFVKDLKKCLLFQNSVKKAIKNLPG